MKFENTAVFNLEGALRGMRFPLQSNNKSDSHYCLPNECVTCKYGNYQDAKNDPYNWEACAENIDWTPYLIGENDMNLAQRLVKGQSPHNKFTRQILVSMDISASLKWWKQMDQYKVATVTNSESTMHRISANPITSDCFELTENITDIEKELINYLEELRLKYLETKDMQYWYRLIDWLPESFIQKRHWTANYAVLGNIWYWRCKTPHKLKEWAIFGEHIKTLPYAKELIIGE